MAGFCAAVDNRGLKRLYERGDRSKLPADMADKIEDILSALDVASDPQELHRPSYRLHALTGDRRGFWAVTVRANWRIVFRFEAGHARDVDFVDYH